VGSPKLGHTQGFVEDELVERIRGTLGGGIDPFGLRDDAGVVEVPGGGSLLVSVDSVVAGVHFDLAWCTPADVGWKALMGALSDLAAMGARPVGAVVALCGPSGDVVLGVMDGVAEASAASGCPVVGGDVSSAAELMVSVTVMGTVGDGDGVPVGRAGAQDGDVLLVTGPCGGSAAGLRTRGGPAFLRPVARLAEGTVARLGGAHAMIDISDGLALDLHRLADASGVGFQLGSVPVAEGATLDEALGGGEDYELLMAVGEADVVALMDEFGAAGLRKPWRIGAVTADAEVRQLGDEELPRLGWQHPLS
jgi:thiamine-monophosphate kinase